MKTATQTVLPTGQIPVSAASPLVLRIGRRARIACTDLEDASRQYQIARENSYEGASTFPTGTVEKDGKVYQISYNGRVWDGETLVLEAAR